MKVRRSMAALGAVLALIALEAEGQLEGLLQRAMRSGGVAATAPARPVAVVTQGSAALPAGTQLYVGQTVELGGGQVTIAYLSPCAIEVVRGGTLTVAPFGSVVTGGSITSGAGSCDPARILSVAPSIPAVPGTVTVPEAPGTVTEPGVIVVRELLMLTGFPVVEVPDAAGFVFQWSDNTGVLAVWQVGPTDARLIWEDLGRGRGVFYPTAAPQFEVGPVYAAQHETETVFFRLVGPPSPQIITLDLGGPSRTGSGTGGAPGGGSRGDGPSGGDGPAGRPSSGGQNGGEGGTGGTGGSFTGSG